MREKLIDLLLKYISIEEYMIINHDEMIDDIITLFNNETEFIKNVLPDFKFTPPPPPKPYFNYTNREICYKFFDLPFHERHEFARIHELDEGISETLTPTEMSQLYMKKALANNIMTQVMMFSIKKDNERKARS